MKTDKARIKALEQMLAYSENANYELQKIIQTKQLELDSADLYYSYVEDEMYKRGFSMETSERLH